MEEEMILNKNSNKKKVILLGMLLLIVILGTVGVAYAVYRFQTEGDSSELITGDIYMHYKGQNTGISIDNAVPSKTYDEERYFEFTIEGKNTYREKDIWYEIDLVEGDEPEGRKTRINDKYLRFTLTEQIGSGQEKTVVNSVGYDDITNKKIWVNKIDRNTNEEIKITYKLYMWISDEVHIGYDDENEIQSDYTLEEWANNIYASVKVNVKGDFIEKEIDEIQYPRFNMIEKIKEKAYTDEKEIIMLDVTDKSNVTKCVSAEACAEKEEVEYRYNGPEVNNYIILTDNEGTEEMWRIIGIFEDETAGQYVKIVRDEVLPTEKLPDYYTASNKQQYKIKPNSTSNSAYFNMLEPHDTSSLEKNNWPDAGLQYWLNDTETSDGYLTKLSSDVKDKLVSVKHYLGAVDSDTGGWVKDTPKQAYAHERDVESCVGNKSTSSNKAGCYVNAGNDATWIGKVSLMYSSDYGLSAIDTNWDTKLGSGGEINFGYGSVYKTTWMFSTSSAMSDARTQSWLISPVSYNSFEVASLAGSVNGNLHAYHCLSVRPVLNLSFQTLIVGYGDGTKSNPYKIA